jgi:hypothetical protein
MRSANGTDNKNAYQLTRPRLSLLSTLFRAIATTKIPGCGGDSLMISERILTALGGLLIGALGTCNGLVR